MTFIHYFPTSFIANASIFLQIGEKPIRMKKPLLLSLFTLLSAAVFAQYGGCGAEPHSSASNFAVAKDTQYQVSDLRDGMYLLQLVDAQNKTVATRKLYKSDQAVRF